MSAYIPVDLQQEVRESFVECCAYCRTPEALSIAIFEIEHIVPRSAGGDSILQNLCLSCPACNRYKAARSVARDATTGQDVVLFHPQREEWAAHFAWNGDGTMIDGLTPTGRATVLALRMNRPQLIRVRQLWMAAGQHPIQTD